MFVKQNFNTTDKEEIKNQYMSFYNEILKGQDIKVYFDNVSYTNGMSVYISFVKEGSEFLQMRHSDHINNIGFGVYRTSFQLETNGSLLPSKENAEKVIEILNKYKN
jgi:hypothetical protein